MPSIKMEAKAILIDRLHWRRIKSSRLASYLPKVNVNSGLRCINQCRRTFLWLKPVYDSVLRRPDFEIYGCEICSTPDNSKALLELMMSHYFTMYQSCSIEIEEINNRKK